MKYFREEKPYAIGLNDGEETTLKLSFCISKYEANIPDFSEF